MLLYAILCAKIAFQRFFRHKYFFLTKNILDVISQLTSNKADLILQNLPIQDGGENDNENDMDTYHYFSKLHEYHYHLLVKKGNNGE